MSDDKSKPIDVEVVSVRALPAPKEPRMTLGELVDSVADQADELVDAGQRAKRRGLGILEKLGIELGTDRRGPPRKR